VHDDTVTLMPALCGVPFEARGSGALWLPSERTLVISDLHFGKAERNARRGGGFWPPYENTETLARLDAEIEVLDPACVIALGDSFDDDACADRLDDATRTRIDKLITERRWIWITGNHDPAPSGFGGEVAEAVTLGPLTLRHIAEPGAQGEVSGHYHPKASLRIRGRRIARKCFLVSDARIVMPAFGAFTGGLDVFDPAFAPLFDGEASVVLTGNRAVALPLKHLRRAAA
jgi:DNA ligase-associated metallophosphoesterase